MSPLPGHRTRRSSRRAAAGGAVALLAVALTSSILGARTIASGALAAPPAREVALPQDFAVRLSGATGRAIPGEYAELDIRIDHSGRGAFTYRPFRDGVRDVEGAFSVSASILRQLREVSEGLWTATSTPSEALPGGRAPLGITLSRGGRSRTLTRPLAAPHEASAQRLDSLVRAAVPQEFWDRVATANATPSR